MIVSFDGKYKFLSNFYLGEGSAVIINGIVYETTEHAFQAGKFIKRSDRKAVAGCASPGDAKRFARAHAKLHEGNRPGWKDCDISIFWMLKVLRLKFEHPLMAKKLLATGTELLIEGNNWGDDFWGQVRCDSGWRGENWLGILLMHIRYELRLGYRMAFLPQRFRRASRETWCI
jgi:ribA/ribD-fused uncharacterized protein